MQDYDISLKYLSDKFPEHFVNLIIEGFAGDVILLDKELPSSRRESDYLVRIKDTKNRSKDIDFILHIEFQSTMDVDMPVRMLSYYSRIVDKYRLPVYPVVMYLIPSSSKLTIPDTYMSSIINEDIIKFKYKVLKAWELDSKKIIDNNLYGLIPILPLTRHETIDDTECITSCIDLIRNIDIEDNVLKADMYVCTGILAGLKYSKETIKSLMKVEIMQESVIYKDILNEGMQKGRQEGRQEGLREGLEKGMEKSIISVLSARFDNISTNLVDRIYHIKNESRLDKILELAVTSKTLTEFEQNLQNT